MILNWISKKLALTMLTGFKWLRYGPEADSCEHGNTPSGSDWEFIKQLSSYQIFKKDSVS
jgi:hypothetical protein